MTMPAVRRRRTERTLAQAQQILGDSNVAWGGQDVSQFGAGAYTGAVTATMLTDFGCKYVIVGHSERRAIFGDSDAIVAAKFEAARKAALLQYFDVLELQLQLALQEAGGLRPTAGDAVFIDSSHILMPGSDVDLLLNRVLPELPTGTLVHIHDIFLPFDYPALWGWRNYNEQQGVVPLLVSGAYRPLFASVWIERAMADRISRSIVPSLPRPAEAMPASLWLEKR